MNEELVNNRNDEKVSKGFFSDAFGKLKSNKTALVTLSIIILFVLVAILAPYIAPYSESYQDSTAILSGPTSKHLLGTDEFGRDILSRIIYGTRVSLSVGLVAEVIAATIGVILGAVAGYYGGWIDNLVSRLIEIFGSFPQLLFAIVIMFAIGPGVINVFIAIGIVGWTGIARMIRSQILQLKESEYIEAAQSFGASDFHILFKHLIPNCLPTIIVIMTMAIPADIMYEASLSFLGLGVQPPKSSWGQIISLGRVHLRSNPGYVLFPAIALIITVLSFNLFGDALRDALDPKMKKMSGEG